MNQHPFHKSIRSFNTFLPLSVCLSDQRFTVNSFTVPFEKKSACNLCESENEPVSLYVSDKQLFGSEGAVSRCKRKTAPSSKPWR